MPTQQSSPRSYLFTVRLWVEEISPDQHEVRMQVKHVLSGQARYVREWKEMMAFMLAKVEKVEERRG